MVSAELPPAVFEQAPPLESPPALLPASAVFPGFWPGLIPVLSPAPEYQVLWRGIVYRAWYSIYYIV